MATKPIKPKDIELYLDGKRNQWAPETLRGTKYRLKMALPFLNGSPETLFNGLCDIKPYSRVTTWVNVSAFWFELYGSSVYSDWKRTNSRLFKNAYQPEKLALTYEEAIDRIGQIKSSNSRVKALNMIMSAQRYSDTILPNGDVESKGRVRPNFGANSVPQVKYTTFYNHLKAVGLKPHTLRKLALTRLASNGATAADLCLVAGWSNISTAFFYLQPKRVEELKGLLTKQEAKA